MSTLTQKIKAYQKLIRLRHFIRQPKAFLHHVFPLREYDPDAIVMAIGEQFQAVVLKEQLSKWSKYTFFAVLIYSQK